MLVTLDSVIDDLGGTLALAKSLRSKPSTVSGWRTRGIPATRWPALVLLGARKGCSHVTFEVLAALRPGKSLELRA